MKSIAGKNRFQWFILFLILFGYTKIYSQWQCPSNCSCDNDTVSVACFGAIPNDTISDTSAIQTAINSVPDNWTVYFPSGRYMIDSLPDPSSTDPNRTKGLEIGRDNITLRGEGINSELYTKQGTNFRLLGIPKNNFSQNENNVCSSKSPVVKNILIRDLSFSGDLNTGTKTCPISNGTCSVLFGIFLYEGEDITFRDILVKDFGIEGITVSNGAHPSKNITFQRVRVQRIRRQGIHIGFAENVLIENSLIEDNSSDVWSPFGGGGVAIDIEPEGLDCSVYPPIQRDPYVYDIKIKNSLLKNTTSEISRGGMSFAPAFGPVRKIDIQNNIIVNSTGITTRGDNGNSSSVDPRIGQSLRIRDVNISSNWVGNIHPNQPPYDTPTQSLFLVNTGDVADIYGTNGLTVNDNVFTVYIDGGSYRLFQFDDVKELTGNNNKTFRPYQVISNGNVLAGTYNFLWSKEISGANNNNFQMLNTLDNGWSGSRLVLYEPPNWSYISFLPGTGNNLTWVDNLTSTPTSAPTVNSIKVRNNLDLWFNVTRNLIDEPVRIMVLHNDLPLGVRDIRFDGAYLNTTAFIRLKRKAKAGDVFKVMAFSETGQFTETTYTYNY